MGDPYTTAQRVAQLMGDGLSREDALAKVAADEQAADTHKATRPDPTPVTQRVTLPVVMGLSAEARKPWWEMMPPDVVDAKFEENWNRIREIEEYVTNPQRPLHALVMSCSGRNNKLSCAHEEARTSKTTEAVVGMLGKRGFEVTHFDLWDMNIEHCNGCYGTEDYWCHWPCSCWPFDDMQHIYEEVVKADVIVIISPVNEASAASRFHQMWHRGISLDGGFAFKPPPGWQKSADELAKMRLHYGEQSGIAQADPAGFVQRFNGKAFGVVVLGHEIGAQTAVSQISASVQYRGAYVPPHAAVAKIYAGAGPNANDRKVISSRNDFTEELAHQLNEMCESLAIEARANRTKTQVRTKIQRA